MWASACGAKFIWEYQKGGSTKTKSLFETKLFSCIKGVVA